MSKALIASASFARRLLKWQQQHGRHDLPWQASADPYRVWLSEIMLQQTQVVTVIPYYKQFLHKFPTVKALAQAHEDEVLGLWSGLGYYSRARNLHRCAQRVVAEHGGVFPTSKDALQRLPGIGPSTAAAIASLCFGQREAILDGNVKRVLTRVWGFGHDLSQNIHEKALWQLAQQVLPTRAADMPRYTQGMMDLGATLCTRSRPACERCPMQDMCMGQQQGNPTLYPVKLRKPKRSAQAMWLLFANTDDGEACLQQRPTKGVWASLYTPPIFNSEQEVFDAVPPVWRDKVRMAPAFVHVLTHKDLHLHVAHLRLSQPIALALGQWFKRQAWTGLGMPAPVLKLLQD
jgi:A/G-specific adenine glycosylase